MLPLTAALGVVLAARAYDGDHSFVSVLLAIVGISALIAIHELGHFLACRLTGTRVETFAIGFGPRLIGWETPKGGKRRLTFGRRQFDATTGAMDVRFSAIPLGGYVKMAGEIGGDGSATSGVGGAPREPLPDEFPAKSVSQRIFIASAGVIMNMFAAVACYAAAYGVGVPESPPVLGDVAPGGPAWQAGLRAGDRVVAYDGKAVRTFGDVRTEVILTPRDRTVEVEVERGGKRVLSTLTPAYDEKEGMQQARVLPSARLTVVGEGGKKLVVGPTDAATVDARPVVGGAQADGAVRDAFEAGRRRVRVERGGEAVELDLATAWGTPSKAAPRRLGVAAYVPLVARAVRPGSPATAAGLAVGDEVVAADGAPVWRRGDLAARATLSTLAVRREGREVTLTVAAADAAAVAALLDAVAFETEPPAEGVRVLTSSFDFVGGSPAAAGGVRDGDRLLELDGKPVKTWKDVLAAGLAFTEKPVALLLQTGTEAPRTVSVVPAAPRDPASGEARYVASIVREPVPVDGPLDVIALGARRAWGDVTMTFRSIARFFGNDISFSQNVSGPLSIAQMSSGAASLGMAAFLSFLAFISVNLAVLNVLPVPVLDGGTIVLLLVEKLRGGRRLSDRTVGNLQLVGMALLLLLMVFALRNDVKNVFGVGERP